MPNDEKVVFDCVFSALLLQGMEMDRKLNTSPRNYEVAVLIYLELAKMLKPEFEEKAHEVVKDTLIAFEMQERRN